MKFHELAQAFDALEKEPSRLGMTRLLADLFKKATPEEAQIISYFSLGVLQAPYQGYQLQYGEKSSIKLLARILSEDEHTIAQRQKKVGDMGLLIQQSAWPFTDHALSVQEVYKLLCMFEGISGTGSQEEKTSYLFLFFSKMDALSASFVFRLLSGSMRLGFSDMTVVDALSWMISGDKSSRGVIEEAYNLCADIGLIAQRIKDGGLESLKKMEPILGIPIRPAAAERMESAAAIVKRLGDCVAQPKIDGFRVQIHIDKKNDKTWFFSRNLLDMSAMFPDIKKEVLKSSCDSCIVEGEAVLYDEKKGKFLPFQETVKRKRKHGVEQMATDLPLRLYLFDILYCDGKSLLSKTHGERRSILLSLFGKSGSVRAIEEQKIMSAHELEEYFKEQIKAGLEGVVVKRPDSTYQAGRRNFNWIKLKRHEEKGAGLNDTIDAVVLGYYKGKGKRAKFGIGAFLVGLYRREKDQFETVAKIGTGLSDEQWLELKKKCDAHERHEKPVNVSCAPELEPDIWVYPEITVIIRADEITLSPSHTAGGMALRFPRFIDYCVDKTPTQVTSVHELKRLYDLQH